MQPDNQQPVEAPSVSTSPPKNRFNFSGSFFKIASLILLAAVVVILVLWTPWNPQIKASDRTITVTGDATITAVPDEYIFSPSYNFTDANQQTALNNFTTQNNQIVAQLEKLGVASSAIQTDSSNSTGGIYLPVVTNTEGNTNYTLNLTVTIDNATLAQKVQNYLLTTNPTGQISPSEDFSTATQKTLDDQARNQAEQDARNKADQSAKNLGFSIAAVKSVQDGSLFNPVYPLNSGLNSTVNSGAASATPSLNLQPGKNTLNYSVTVVYYIH
jgi:uncharacterized protein YggE